MTDESHTPPIVPPEDIVEQTIERAANKVAEASVPATVPIMKRSEAFIAVALLLIINLSNLVVAVQGRNDTRWNHQDHKTICEIVVAAVPHDVQDPNIARLLARCIK